MTPSPFDHRCPLVMGRGAWCVFIILLCLVVGDAACPAEGADTLEAVAQGATRPSDMQGQAKPIEITADRLISDTQNHLARFEGHVKAIQGDTTIEANQLQIHYKPEKNPQTPSGADALSKITASGNVRIKFDNRLAVTDEAVYITDQRILTLRGSPAKVTSGMDQVTGSVIKFYRDSGRIEVQGEGGKQVEAIFHSRENGLE